jgi:hypothetical protein
LLLHIATTDLWSTAPCYSKAKYIVFHSKCLTLLSIFQIIIYIDVQNFGIFLDKTEHQMSWKAAYLISHIINLTLWQLHSNVLKKSEIYNEKWFNNQVLFCNTSKTIVIQDIKFKRIVAFPPSNFQMLII